MAIDLVWLQSQFSDLANLTPLGKGGQKVVFSADHASDGSVVLKLIYPHQSLETVQREILAVRQIQSSRVPRILAEGQLSSPLGQCIWLREQRIDGTTVRQRLQNGPLDENSVLRLGLHVLEALTLAEQAGIVHRDVKPDNIMQDPAGAFWLLDFGLARHLNLPSLTATALPFGKFTPGYAPPEQFRNVKADIDARADLFALGATLYECATGINPFRDRAPNQLEVLRRVEQTVLPRLSLNIAAAAEFADLINAVTQRRRDHRPFTAEEALTWLRDICTRNGVC